MMGKTQAMQHEVISAQVDGLLLQLRLLIATGAYQLARA